MREYRRLTAGARQRAFTRDCHAIGAGGVAGRIVRQLITESLVLSAAGGLFGLALAYSLSGAGSALVSQFMPTLFGADRTLELASS